jgi:hypothetical protein
MKRQRESSTLVGDSVDLSGPDKEGGENNGEEDDFENNGEDEAASSSASSSSSSANNSRKRNASDDTDALRVDEESGKESLEPGKRVKVRYLFSCFVGGGGLLCVLC